MASFNVKTDLPVPLRPVWRSRVPTIPPAEPPAPTNSPILPALPAAPAEPPPTVWLEVPALPPPPAPTVRPACDMTIARRLNVGADPRTGREAPLIPPGVVCLSTIADVLSRAAHVVALPDALLTADDADLLPIPPDDAGRLPQDLFRAVRALANWQSQRTLNFVRPFEEFRSDWGRHAMALGPFAMNERWVHATYHMRANWLHPTQAGQFVLLSGAPAPGGPSMTWTNPADPGAYAWANTLASRSGVLAGLANVTQALRSLLSRNFRFDMTKTRSPTADERHAAETSRRLLPEAPYAIWLAAWWRRGAPATALQWIRTREDDLNEYAAHFRLAL